MTLQYLFDEFIGKNVQVFTNNDCFEGTLSFSKANHVLTVKPNKEQTIKRFGPVLIDADAVTAIRLAYIIEPKKYDDCEDSCSETKG